MQFSQIHWIFLRFRRSERYMFGSHIFGTYDFEYCGLGLTVWHVV